MNKKLLDVYYQLPASIQSLLASLYGQYLCYWRYGSESHRLVSEALERERWSQEQWRRWREERLKTILHLAATKVPYYRQQWSKRRQGGDVLSWDRLENWPVLAKETVRSNPKAFVADGCNFSQLYKEHTSGTTGTPLDLWCSRSTLRQWYALSEARWRRWYGVSSENRWAIIGGQKIVPFEKEKPPFWVWNKTFHQLYMSSLHMRQDLLPHYVKALKDYSIEYLYSYSHSAHLLALESLKKDSGVKLKVVVTNAEPLFSWQRQSIQDAFSCPVRETYGQAEMLCAASECEFGKMHVWPEVGFEELLDSNDAPVRPGVMGRIISTGLLNDVMPLIRYDTTDLAQYPVVKTPCGCGRTLPVVEKFIGRMDDVIVTRDGRHLVQMDTILGTHLHIKEAQITQESIDDFSIKVVPSGGWSSLDEDTLCKSLREKVGDVQVEVIIVKEIPKTWRGKFRIIQSKVTRKTIL